MADNRSIFVYQPESKHAEELDALLWSFNETSFIPHQLQVATDITAPIVIGDDPTSIEPKNLMVNLSTVSPPQHQQFHRLLEIVFASDEHRLAARERYKAYRVEGATLQSHTIQLTMD